MKGYYIADGYMGLIDGAYRLFADETKKLQEQLDIERAEREEQDKIIEEINANLDAQGSLVESMKKQMAEKEKAIAGRDKTISELELSNADLLYKINVLEAKLNEK